MKYISIYILILMTGCKSQKITIDENPNVIIKDAFYQKNSAAIKEGNSYVNITLDIDLIIKDNSIKIIGLYFMNDYSELNQNTTNKKYIASIVQSEKKEKLEDFPFQLKPTEFVLKYKEDKKIKHGLFKIKRKDTLDDVPM